MFARDTFNVGLLSSVFIILRINSYTPKVFLCQLLWVITEVTAQSALCTSVTYLTLSPVHFFSFYYILLI